MPRPARPVFRPAVVPLEGRSVPATLYVDDSFALTADRDANGVVSAGDRVTFSDPALGTVANLTFEAPPNPLLGDVGRAFRSVEAAVAASADGDQIFVGSGTFTHTGPLAVNKDVTIRGAGDLATKVLAAGPPPGQFDKAVSVTAPGVTIENLALGWQQGSTRPLATSGGDGYVLYLNPTADGATVSNVRFDGQKFRSAVVFDGADNVVVEGSAFTGTWGRAAVRDADSGAGGGLNVTVRNNRFLGDHYQIGAFSVQSEGPFSGTFSGNFVLTGVEPGNFSVSLGNYGVYVDSNARLAAAGFEVRGNTFDWRDAGVKNQANAFAKAQGVNIGSSATAATGVPVSAGLVRIADNIFRGYRKNSLDATANVVTAIRGTSIVTYNHNLFFDNSNDNSDASVTNAATDGGNNLTADPQFVGTGVFDPAVNDPAAFYTIAAASPAAGSASDGASNRGAGGAKSAATAGDFRLVRTGSQVAVFLDARDGNGELLFAQVPVADPLTLSGGEAVGDTFTLDYSGGSPIPSGGLALDGKGGVDKLQTTNGSHAAVAFAFTDSQSGTLTVDGQAVSFAGTEQVAVGGSVGSASFALTAAGDAVTMATRSGLVELAGPTVPTATVAPPTGTLSVDGMGGADALTVGDVGQPVAVPAVVLSASTAGLDLTAETVTVVRPVTVGGLFKVTAANDITFAPTGATTAGNMQLATSGGNVEIGGQLLATGIDASVVSGKEVAIRTSSNRQGSVLVRFDIAAPSSVPGVVVSGGGDLRLEQRARVGVQVTGNPANVLRGPTKYAIMRVSDDGALKTAAAFPILPTVSFGSEFNYSGISPVVALTLPARTSVTVRVP